MMKEKNREGKGGKFLVCHVKEKGNEKKGRDSFWKMKMNDEFENQSTQGE